MNSEQADPTAFNQDLNQDGRVNYRDAAIQAELDTGRAEESVEKAWRNVLFRFARIGLGFLLLIASIPMWVGPGPGAVATAAGLALLARDFVWADRALRYLRRVVPGIDEEGPIPRRTIVISLVIMVAAGVAAYLWGDDVINTVRGWL